MNIGQRPRQGSGAQVVVIGACAVRTRRGPRSSRARYERPARPTFYHHLRDSVEAHLTIVFAALAVGRSTEHQPAGPSANRQDRPPLPHDTDPGRDRIPSPPPTRCLTTSARPSARSTARPVRTNLAQLRLRAGSSGSRARSAAAAAWTRLATPSLQARDVHARGLGADEQCPRRLDCRCARWRAGAARQLAGGQSERSGIGVRLSSVADVAAASGTRALWASLRISERSGTCPQPTSLADWSVLIAAAACWSEVSSASACRHSSTLSPRY